MHVPQGGPKPDQQTWRRSSLRSNPRWSGRGSWIRPHTRRNAKRWEPSRTSKVHQFAAHMDAVQAGGDVLGDVIVILLIVVIVIAISS